MLREYWHSGNLNHVLITGQHQILLAGVNNAAKAATLVALDPDTMDGASSEDNPEYQLEGLPHGTETAPLLFPPNCLNRILEPIAVTLSLWQEPEEITAVVQQQPDGDAIIVYCLNPDLP